MITPRLAIPNARLAEFCRRWKIAELSLFGSVLREDFRPDSDVDVLVRFAPDAPWSAFDLVTMRDELAALVGREVDLVEQDALRNPFRRAAILRDKRVIYAA
jgi:uncharacterized protein